MRRWWVLCLLAAPALAARLTDPSPAAFETALMNVINSTGYNRQGLLTDMVEIGQFYCTQKQSGAMPWQSQMNGMHRFPSGSPGDGKDVITEYIANMNDATQVAVAKWEVWRFHSPQGYQQWLQNFPRPTDEISMYYSAAAQAEYHLCPGWPDHPMPAEMREDHQLE